jgi:hypothetical protein
VRYRALRDKKPNQRKEGREMSDVLQDLLIRVARLEAKEACVSRFNEYLHYLDGEFVDDLIGLFAEDALLEVKEYPPGTGNNLEFKGLKEIRPLYEEHRGVMARHHSANVTVNVRPDGKTADLSAYFLTAVQFAVTGGVYEATLELVDGKWLFTWLRISSNWGWAVVQDYPPFLDKPLGAGTRREGRPVLYEAPGREA